MTSLIKSIFTVTGPETGTRDIENVIAICKDLDAHLSVLVADIAFPAVTSQYGTASAIHLGEEYAHGVESLDGRARKLQARLDETRLSADVNTAYAVTGEIDNMVAGHARCADLTVLPARLPVDTPLLGHALHGALFKSGAPVLIMPTDAAVFPAVKRAMIAWDGGPYAARAVRDAIGLLTLADQVQSVVVNVEQGGAGMNDQLARYLNRHGIAVTQQEVRRQGQNVSKVLLEAARNNHADLIVMGGYGHSRLRERLFGGTTRNMIEKTPVALLMSH